MIAKDVPHDVFLMHAKKTAKNIKAVYNILKNTDKKVYGVLHGGIKEQWDLWWKIAIEPFLDVFYGIAIAVKPVYDIRLMARMLRYVYQKDIRNVHVFAVSSLKALPVLVEAKDMFNLLTFDSSTPLLCSKLGEIFNTNVKGCRLTLGRKFLKKFNNRIDPQFCYCPACIYARRNNLNIYFPESHMEYILNGLHNLIQYVSYLNLLTFLKDCNYQLSNFIELRTETKSAIRLLKRDGIGGLDRWL